MKYTSTQTGEYHTQLLTKAYVTDWLLVLWGSNSFIALLSSLYVTFVPLFKYGSISNPFTFKMVLTHMVSFVTFLFIIEFILSWYSFIIAVLSSLSFFFHRYLGCFFQIVSALIYSAFMSHYAHIIIDNTKTLFPILFIWTFFPLLFTAVYLFMLYRISQRVAKRQK